MGTPLNDPYTGAAQPAKGVGGLQISVGSGKAVNAISGGAKLVTDQPARLARVSVTVAGTTTGSVNDAASTGGAAAGNLVAVIPNVVGVFELDWPCAAGIVITPGSGQTVSVSYA